MPINPIILYLIILYYMKFNPNKKYFEVFNKLKLKWLSRKE